MQNAQAEGGDSAVLHVFGYAVYSLSVMNNRTGATIVAHRVCEKWREGRENHCGYTHLCYGIA